MGGKNPISAVLSPVVDLFAPPKAPKFEPPAPISEVDRNQIAYNPPKDSGLEGSIGFFDQEFFKKKAEEQLSKRDKVGGGV